MSSDRPAAKLASLDVHEKIAATVPKDEFEFAQMTAKMIGVNAEATYMLDWLAERGINLREVDD